MWYDFCEFLVIIVLCSSTDFRTDLVWLREVNLRVGELAPPLTASAEVAVRNRCRDSLKLGPDSMADSSPERSEEK
jgi:hypothetical protein